MNAEGQNMALPPGQHTLGEKSYTLHPLLPSDFAAARAYFREKNPSPLDTLKDRIAGLPEAAVVRLAEKAYDDDKLWGNLNQCVEAKDWANSVEGAAFFYHRSTRTPPEEFNVIYEAMKSMQQSIIEMMIEQIQTISGLITPEDKLKNSEGPLVKQLRKKLRVAQKRQTTKTGKK